MPRKPNTKPKAITANKENPIEAETVSVEKKHSTPPFMKTQTSATKGEVGKLLASTTKWAKYPPVKTDEECAERVQLYFEECVKAGELPSVEDLSLALGTDRRRVWEWEQGKKGPIRSDIIKKAKEILAAFDAKMAQNGKLNPVLYIFRSKNYYGLKDQTDHVITANSGYEQPKTPEELDKLVELPPDDSEE